MSTTYTRHCDFCAGTVEGSPNNWAQIYWNDPGKKESDICGSCLRILVVKEEVSV